MASDGDTITYTFSGGTSVSEDVSNVNRMTVDYLNGSGGSSSEDGNPGGSGGRVENTIVDLSGINVIYLWVGSSDTNTTDFASSRTAGRYSGLTGFTFGADVQPGQGGASTEVSLVDTPAPFEHSGNPDEPFIVAAGGGSGGESADGAGGAAARGAALGTAPPQGGQPSGNDGEGAVAGHDTNATIIDSGTTTTGAGSGTDTAGEIQITYATVTNAPPSIVEPTATPADGATDVSVDPTLSIDVSDADGDDIDVTFIDESDGTQIGTTQTVTGGSGTASVAWSGRDFDTSYQWSVEGTDGAATTASSTFSFTTTPLTAPTLGTPFADGNSEIVIPWTQQDAVADGGVDIERATNGGSFSTVASGLDPAAGEYATGTPVPDTDTYTYRVERNASGASATSGTADVFVDYQITITGTNSPVEAGEALDVNVDVTNNGTIEGDQDITLSLTEQ